MEDQAKSLNRQALQAMSQGRLETAGQLLDQALSLDPHSLSLLFNRAGVFRATRDFPGALSVLERVLALDPRSFLALLMKAALIEAMGDVRQAAIGYGIAISLAPPENQLDRATAQALAHGRALHTAYLREMEDFLTKQVGGDLIKSRGGESTRIKGFVNHLLGKRKVYHQEPSVFHYPGVPEIEYYDNDDFPWIKELEANTRTIKDELLAIIQDETLARTAEPYVNYSDSVPLDQWRELNRSMRWSGFHFYYFGKTYQENCARCPKTVELLSHFPQPVIPGKSPAALFSVLQPHTHIPPHTGVSNTRLLCHLPLIVPPGCTFRVGNETRAWEEGKAWVFDDTIEHEARNDSDLVRIILIFDIWHPSLSAAEREAITTIMTSMDLFNETREALPL